MNKNLPIGWVKTKLGEIGSWGSGGTPKATNDKYYNGSIPWAKIGDLNDGLVVKTEDYITEEGLINSSAKIVEEGTLLVAMYGSIGKLGIAGVKLSTNQAIAFCKVNEKLVAKEFVFYYLRSRREHLLSMGQGGTQQNISQTILKVYPILLPPLNEQRRIVEKLDRIFDRLRKVRDELSHIKKLIDRYRQSVLTAAFRGDLTADWRVEKLSDSWHFDNVGNVSTKIHYGYTASSTSVDTGTKLLRITDIQNGTVDWETVPFCEITQTDELKYKLEMGDLLFARTGATVGKSFLIETEIPKAVFASYLIRIILGNNVIRKYVYYFFQSDLYWAQIRDNQIGTGQPNVNGKILSELMIPICPLEEQKEIVRRIEERFAKIEKIEQEYQKAVKLCDRLEQETLAKAFRGELVPQDPNDEPASVLLERIRAERAMLTQPRKKSPLRK